MVTNQNNAWQELFTLVKNNEFQLSKNIACKIHNLAGHNDALLWGCFRDVDVSIAGTDYIANSLYLEHFLRFFLPNRARQEVCATEHWRTSDAYAGLAELGRFCGDGKITCDD